MKIVFLNKKGGVGKTNTSFHAAGELARRKRKVLVIDLDYQSNQSAAWIGNAKVYAIAPESTVAAIADAMEPLPFCSDLIVSTPIAGVDLIPGSHAAERLDQSDPASLPADVLWRLRDVLAEVEGQYDDWIFDCHPSGALLSWMALIAADAVVTPLNPEDSGVQGVGPMIEMIEAVKYHPYGNPNIRHLGLVVNNWKKSGLHSAVEGSLREYYGGLVFDAVIPNAIAYAEALGQRQPICCVKPRSKGAKCMALVVDEMLARDAGHGPEILTPCAHTEEVTNG